MNASAPPLSSSSLAQPAIEPANQPIPPGSAATPLYMNKASSSAGLGDTANEAHRVDNAPLVASVPSVRVLQKTTSTDSMLTDDRATEVGQSSSGGGTPNAGKQRKYERKTKRFIWPDELHRLFIAAIFDVGLKNASPKALLGLMEAAGPNTGLTTEHLKSHLQKYRLNYDRSRAEFLEFYDQSHKRNHKRRRKNGSKPGEPNTMFVFPITHKKSRKGASDDDDSDSDDDGGDRDDAMSDSTLEHVTPHSSSASLHRTESSASLELTSSFTSMMHDPKDQLSAAALAFAQQQQQYIQMMNANNAGDRSSFSGGMASTQAYAAGGLSRKGSLTGPSSASTHHASSAAAAMNHRAIAAAAAAAYQQRFGLSMSATGGAMGDTGNAANAAIGQLGGDLSDPQWSILSSLMSPHITGVNNTGGNIHSGNTMAATSDGISDSGDQFQLQEEATDLQMQMHLAMQAQMNLHRQMLTRKVEVSQHINSTTNSSSSGPNANFGGVAWSPHHHHQQHQQQHQQQQQYFEQQRAVRQALMNSSHHPQQLSLAAANTASIGHAPPRPSLALRTSSSGNVLAPSDPMGVGHPTHHNRPPIPLAVGPTVTVPTAMIQESSDHDGNLLVPAAGSFGTTLGYDKNTSPPDGVTTDPTAAPGPGGDDDSLDLYRWDRIDLNVELDDDDLFGFLKS